MSVLWGNESLELSDRKQVQMRVQQAAATMQVGGSSADCQAGSYGSLPSQQVALL